MSNGILPVQSTKPLMREWMLTRLFTDRGLSSEFYNRMMNLCNYDYPMSPDLRGLVESKFGFDMLGTIEQYSTREKPVLNSGLRASIRRVIPDEYYLEFLRLFDCTCCPLIIGEYATYDDIPAGTAVDQLAIVAHVNSGLFQVITLYEWDGAVWASHVTITATTYGGFFTSIDISNDEGDWEVSIDSGATWHAASVLPIDPPQGTLPVWYRNNENGCIYTNVPQLPLSYCTDWAVVDVGAFFDFTGTFNQITPPNDFPTLLATMIEPYQLVEGAVGGLSYNIGDTTMYIQVSRPSSAPVTASLATILDAIGDPVPAPPTNTTCGLNTYTTQFTPVAPLNTIAIRSMTINGIIPSASGATIFDAEFVTDANCAYSIVNNLQTLVGMYDPLMQINIYNSGQTVFVQVQSIYTFTELFWQDATNTESGTAIFT